MASEPPTPPATLPIDIVITLTEASEDRLRDVASYAEALPDHNERDARLDGASGQDEVADRMNDRPKGVPAKATVTIKDINENRYYYRQWREGDRVKSKYKSPVNPDETN
jgi:hypothetical protein